MSRKPSIIFLLTAAMALAACSVAPQGRTVVLPRPSPTATATPAPAGKLSFELGKISVIPRQELDQAGYFSTDARLVFGWLDDKHLAAVGIKPVASPTDSGAEPQPIQPRAQLASGRYPFVSAAGMIGQILSVDWDTRETTELHTMQDAAVIAMGLSHDKSRLWYLTSSGDGSVKLSVADISFKHDFMEAQTFPDYYPTWSSRDKYLAYMSTDMKETALQLFDGVTSRAYPGIGLYGPGDNQSYIDDDTGQMITLVKGILLAHMQLPSPDEPDVKKPKVEYGRELYQDGPVNGYITQTFWTSADQLLYLVNDKNGRHLEVQFLPSGDPPHKYDGVFNFALSDDRKYICLAKESGGKSADLYVAEWNDGVIENEKLVFKGFIADGGLFFSPDDAKLYVEGRYSYTDPGTVAMVLQFK